MNRIAALGTSLPWFQASQVPSEVCASLLRSVLLLWGYYSFEFLIFLITEAGSVPIQELLVPLSLGSRSCAL